MGQCSPKPNVGSCGSNDKLLQNVSKTLEMINQEVHHPAVGQLGPKLGHLASLDSAQFGSVAPLSRSHPNSQRCPFQLKACLNLVIELLVMVSQLVGDPIFEEPFTFGTLFGRGALFCNETCGS